MKTSFLRLAGLAFLLGVVTTLASAESAPKIVPLGDGSYSVSVEATHKFTRNTEKLKAEATQAANDFCSQQGKHLKVVSVTQSRPMYVVGGMASATLTFKAVDLTDPELAKPAATPATAVEPAAAPITNEQLYADLLRLDDLRKKGILSDAEFAVEKKKVLDRSH